MIRRPKGTRDFDPIEMSIRRWAELRMRKVAESYGYEEIQTPTFEHFELFERKSGEEIRKSMYVFKDHGGRLLALRPELTASVMRFFFNELQSLPRPLKLYYFSNCFRYEEPQAGRYREFWQFGVENIGFRYPEAEAEVISLARDCLREVGLEGDIHVGHLGILRGFLADHGVSQRDQNEILSIIDRGDRDKLERKMEELELPSDSREILRRALEIKGKPDDVLREVEDLFSSYQTAYRAIDDLRELVDSLELVGMGGDYIIDMSIARGLDYYVGMVFEIYIPQLGAQKQVCGGGTYDLSDIFEQPTVLATGFAIGFDRVVEATKILGRAPKTRRSLDVFVAYSGDDLRREAFRIAGDLRRRGLRVDVDLMRRKLSRALSYASERGARFTVIVGKRELERGCVVVKEMERGEQEIIEIERLADYLSERVGGNVGSYRDR